jgi:hypothetical protein
MTGEVGTDLLGTHRVRLGVIPGASSLEEAAW